MWLTPQTLREQGSNDELDKSSKALLVWMVLLLEEVAASRSATDTNLCSQPHTIHVSLQLAAYVINMHCNTCPACWQYLFITENRMPSVLLGLALLIWLPSTPFNL